MRNNSLVTAVIVGIVGLLLIIFQGRGDLLNWIVIILGIMFILPGAYMLVSQAGARKENRSTGSMITAVGCICLGVCLCVIPGVFVSVLIYLFAFTLIFIGVAQMVQIADFKLPMGYYIVPVLVAVTGLIMVFAGAEKDASAIVLITGIALLLYSINMLVEYFKLRKSAGGALQKS